MREGEEERRAAEVPEDLENIDDPGTEVQEEIEAVERRVSEPEETGEKKRTARQDGGDKQQGAARLDGTGERRRSTNPDERGNQRKTARPEGTGEHRSKTRSDGAGGQRRTSRPDNAGGQRKAARLDEASGQRKKARSNEESGQRKAARPDGASGQRKTARPAGQSASGSRQGADGSSRRSAGGSSKNTAAMRSRKNARRLRARRKKQMMLGGIAAVLILLVVLVVVLIRGCGSRKNSGEVNGGGLPEQGSFAVLGGDTASADSTAEAEPTPIPTPTPEPYADKPNIDINSWEYILANATHSIEEYAPELDYFEDVQLDYRIIEPMSEFVSDARNQGLNVFMSSGYRGYDEQSWLFEMKVADYGEEEAAKIVAPPGTSEHQTGLAADITDDYYEYKNESLENTELYKWMSTHCQDYGFIVRFPKGKEDITGIIYEPWHFRYVGKEAAKYIMEHNLTLEEFVELYQKA